MSRLLYLLFLLSLVSACSESDIDPCTQEHLNYEPMAIGNEWIYQVSVEQPDGTFKVNERNDIVRIIGQEIVNGILFFKFEAWRFEDDYQKKNYYKQDFDGYIQNKDNDILYSPKCNEGVLNSVLVIEGDSVLVILDYSMADEFDLVEVPAGTFHTRTYRAEIKPGFFWDERFDCGKFPYDSYAQGIGRVKSENHQPRSCRSIISELVRYDLR